MMTQKTQKIQGTFYPLTTEELIQLGSILTDAEVKTLLYLKALHPFTDSYKELDTSRLAEHLNISRRSVQRFLKKFKRLNLLEYEITTFKYKTTPGSSPFDVTTPGSPKRHQDRQSDTRIAETTPGSPKRHQDRLRSSKGASDKDSGLSQTIQTNQTPQTIQKGVGVENSGSDPVLDLANKEICSDKQSYSQQETVKEEKLVNPKDPDQDQSTASVVQVTTKRVTKSVDIAHKNEGEREKVHPVTPSPCSDIPQDLITKLQDLGISLDGEVRRAIADHDMSQAYGAIKHVENTWETINNPRGVFLFQIPNQRVQKGPSPISENFLEWYQWAIADGLVIDFPAKYLPTNSKGEPKVKLTIDPGWAEDWQKVRDNPDDYRQKLDPTVRKELWAKMGSMLGRPPEPEPEPTLNDQLNDPILGPELYPQIKHSHQVDFTEEGRPYQATPIADIQYDEDGVPKEEVK